MTARNLGFRHSPLRAEVDTAEVFDCAKSSEANQTYPRWVTSISNSNIHRKRRIVRKKDAFGTRESASASRVSRGTLLRKIGHKCLLQSWFDRLDTPSKKFNWCPATPTYVLRLGSGKRQNRSSLRGILRGSRLPHHPAKEPPEKNCGDNWPRRFAAETCCRAAIDQRLAVCDKRRPRQIGNPFSGYSQRAAPAEPTDSGQSRRARFSMALTTSRRVSASTPTRWHGAGKGPSFSSQGRSPFGIASATMTTGSLTLCVSTKHTGFRFANSADHPADGCSSDILGLSA